MGNAQELHQEFIRLGGMRHKLKNRMLIILPEIYKSGIWKRYAGSIIEYAGKFGDIAKTTVIKRLRLEENLENKPYLKAAIEKVGVHKVAMLAKIATPETDSSLAESVLNMSKMAVQSLSKELRAGQPEGNAEGSQQGSLDNCGCDRDRIDQNQSSLCKAVSITKKIDLDEESTFLFMRLKAKLGKHLSDKEFLKIMLEERAKQEFPQKQSKITNEMVSTKNITGDTFHEPRYVRVNKKRQTIAQTNGKCTYPGCNLPCEVLHHTDRYSESKNHNSLVPFCKIHHEFAHNNLIQNETRSTDKWRISVIKTPTIKISQADILYKKYRLKELA